MNPWGMFSLAENDVVCLILSQTGSKVKRKKIFWAKHNFYHLSSDGLCAEQGGRQLLGLSSSPVCSQEQTTFMLKGLVLF